MSRKTLIQVLIAFALSMVALLFPFGSFGITISPVEQRVVAMFVLAALFWIFEPIPIWSTSILIIVLMLFTISTKALPFLMTDSAGVKFSNLIDYKALMATWADPIIMLFMGGFFLATTATKYHLDSNIARVLIKPFGKNPKFVLLGMLMVVALFSMFMSNTASSAMFLAILAPILAVFKDNDKGRIAFALAIPIGANLGGIGTPIGTPPNAIAVKGLAELGIHISFGHWMLFAVPFMLVMLFFAWVLLIKLFPPTTKEINLEIGGKFDKSPKAIIAYITFGVTILLWMTGDFIGLDSNVVAMIPIAVLTISGVVSAKDLNGLAWDVLWLVAGGFALGIGLQKTGLATNLINQIPFDALHIVAIVAIAAAIAFFMSTFMSNSATAALLTPIVGAVAGMLMSAGADLSLMGGATGMIIMVALSCSLAMALPISTPPNAIAYSTGFVKSNDMAKAGLTIGLVGIVLAMGMMMMLGKIGYFAAAEEKAAQARVAVAEQAAAAAAAIPESLTEAAAVEAPAPAATAVEAPAPAATAVEAPAPAAEAVATVNAEAPVAEAVTPVVK